MHEGQGGIPGTFWLVFTFIARVEVILVFKSSIFSAFVAYSYECFLRICLLFSLSLPGVLDSCLSAKFDIL